MLKKLLSWILCWALLLGAPGLAPYQALGASLVTPVAKVQGSPTGPGPRSIAFAGSALSPSGLGISLAPVANNLRVIADVSGSAETGEGLQPQFPQAQGYGAGLTVTPMSLPQSVILGGIGSNIPAIDAVEGPARPRPRFGDGSGLKQNRPASFWRNGKARVQATVAAIQDSLKAGQGEAASGRADEIFSGPHSRAGVATGESLATGGARVGEQFPVRNISLFQSRESSAYDRRFLPVVLNSSSREFFGWHVLGLTAFAPLLSYSDSTQTWDILLSVFSYLGPISYWAANILSALFPIWEIYKTLRQGRAQAAPPWRAVSGGMASFMLVLLASIKDKPLWGIQNVFGALMLVAPLLIRKVFFSKGAQKTQSKWIAALNTAWLSAALILPSLGLYYALAAVVPGLFASIFGAASFSVIGLVLQIISVVLFCLLFLPDNLRALASWLGQRSFMSRGLAERLNRYGKDAHSFSLGFTLTFSLSSVAFCLWATHEALIAPDFSSALQFAIQAGENALFVVSSLMSYFFMRSLKK